MANNGQLQRADRSRVIEAWSGLCSRRPLGMSASSSREECRLQRLQARKMDSLSLENLELLQTSFEPPPPVKPHRSPLSLQPCPGVLGYP